MTLLAARGAGARWLVVVMCLPACAAIEAAPSAETLAPLGSTLPQRRLPAPSLRPGSTMHG